MIIEENPINYKRIATSHVISGSKLDIFQLELLIKRGFVDPNMSINSNNDRLIHQSIIKKKINVFIMLLSLPSVNKNIRNAHGETPLFLATKLGLKHFVSEILKHDDINIDLENYAGITPHQISSFNQYNTIYNLISEKKNVITNNIVTTPTIISNIYNNTSNIPIRRRAVRILNSPTFCSKRLNLDSFYLPDHFTNKHKELILLSKEQCKICLEEYKSINNIQILNKCYHELCDLCYNKVLKYNKRCPFCREIILL
jgi:hypothetical protein